MLQKNSVKPSILIIYTGGTIGMIKDYETSSLKAFNFNQMLSKLPELQQLHCAISSISFIEPIDSSEMNIDYYNELADILYSNYNNYDGFVVLSGTDTMSYVASAISFMFENLKKPIIFTGSQLPIGELRTDAKENLLTAIEIACVQEKGEPLLQEVGLYFEYELYRANRTTKVSASEFKAFTSMNYPLLAKSGVSLKFNRESLYRNDKNNIDLVLKKKFNPNIVVLSLFPGITEAVVESILTSEGLKGVILYTYGSGNAFTNKWFIKKLALVIKNEIPVVNVTQCLDGKVEMGLYETSSALKKTGIINGKDITLESAITKMMYLLGEKLTIMEFKKYFEEPLRGEMD